MKDITIKDYPDRNGDLRMDLVTVFHNERNYLQHVELENDILKHHPGGGFRFIAVDNRINNRGFAAACNVGASHGNSRIIGFINPDANVHGSFMIEVIGTFAMNNVVITGPRYSKPQRELDLWGVRDWVCGAAFFVRRYFFEEVGGFDERFVWSFEETDLIRTAESMKYKCMSKPLAIDHASPAEESAEDAAYKRRQFAQSQQRFYEKWKRGATNAV